VLDGSELADLKEALQANDLLSHNYLLTGYIGRVFDIRCGNLMVYAGSNGFLSNILDLLTTMQSIDPDTKYVCDPVLGDHGRYYVPKELVSIFRESVIPRCVYALNISEVLCDLLPLEHT
jgi:pyridoxine kinase